MTLQHHALNSFRNSYDTLWVTNKVCKGEDNHEHEKCQGKWVWPDSNLQVMCLCGCHSNANANEVREKTKKVMCARSAKSAQQQSQSQPTTRTDKVEQGNIKNVATTIGEELKTGPQIILGLSGADILSRLEYNFANRYPHPFDKQAYMRKYVLAKKSKSRWWE
jgi:hypothetical protein